LPCSCHRFINLTHRYNIFLDAFYFLGYVLAQYLPLFLSKLLYFSHLSVSDISFLIYHNTQQCFLFAFSTHSIFFLSAFLLFFFLQEMFSILPVAFSASQLTPYIPFLLTMSVSFSRCVIYLCNTYVKSL
jgi:hypothetical protein